jgi:hypothetical protein
MDSKETIIKIIRIGEIATAGSGGGAMSIPPQTWDGLILNSEIEAGTKEEPDKKIKPEPERQNPIKDSGERTKFESGAVRDMHEGKGRCDLLPLKVVAKLPKPDEPNLHLLYVLADYQKEGSSRLLYTACSLIREEFFNGDAISEMLELAIHFEDGCKKYGENNWQKGIPVHSFIDSAIRHYLKHKRGDTDERHDRACLWNLVCAIWTVENKPELNDYQR